MKSRPLKEGLALVLERVQGSLQQATAEDFFPHAAPSATGVWEGKRDGMWTSGFWAGLLWQRAALTGCTEDVRAATGWTLRLAPHTERKTLDIGFVFWPSAVAGWEIGTVPACRDLALQAAACMADMLDPVAGVIPVGIHAELAAASDDVIIDCMGSLPLLWWAWKATGEVRFRDAAASHARQTAMWHVKTDGRVIQSIHFDLRTGHAIKDDTHQGSGTDGCWSRGQAWAIYGFAAAFHATGEECFLEVANRAAAYYFRRAGSNLIPFYCFDDPAQPNVPKDTSAAAIACAGLTILANHAPDPGTRQRSSDQVQALLRALVTDYLTPQNAEDHRPPGMLLHGCYNKNAGWDTDHELVCGSYFLLDSLRRWTH